MKDIKICSAGILFKNNKILLGKRANSRRFYPNVWDLIGGHCSKNEKPADALRRELKEEIGVYNISSSELAILDEPEPDKNGIYKYYIYLIKEWIGSPKNLKPKEHSKIEWFTIKDALKLELAHPKYFEIFKNLKTCETSTYES
jgi:8-oxo-dGTP diphosphatase